MSDIEKKFLNARVLRDAGRFREAIQQYKLCISNAETTPEIKCMSFHEMGLCYAGIKFTIVAIDYYELAIQVSQLHDNKGIENAALRDMALCLLRDSHVNKEYVLHIIERSITVAPDENSKIKSEIFRERIIDKLAEQTEPSEEKEKRLKQTIGFLYDTTMKDAIRQDRYFLKKVYEYLSEFTDKLAEVIEASIEHEQQKSFLVDKRKRIIRKLKKWLRKILHL